MKFDAIFKKLKICYVWKDVSTMSYKVSWLGKTKTITYDYLGYNENLLPITIMKIFNSPNFLFQNELYGLKKI